MIAKVVSTKKKTTDLRSMYLILGSVEDICNNTFCFCKSQLLSVMLTVQVRVDIDKFFELPRLHKRTKEQESSVRLPHFRDTKNLSCFFFSSFFLLPKHVRDLVSGPQGIKGINRRQPILLTWNTIHPMTPIRHVPITIRRNENTYINNLIRINKNHKPRLLHLQDRGSCYLSLPSRP